ncbi:FKBP-type peptidyl-prolyl cis-trans isomerase [Gallaecimonas kandeliae]|uniref:FKBP-type peptidyl-prolyl cis-trans isomerase n=1 Tax=Gallaecimonas kandeliae TaxID=3029055 RepID=UPI002649CDE8|nr:FKBP-type peptidyl-prolyl cis-trans isomerase [Gallaecimonas kandeliae]WKE67405.1 FKBP-type peptidyl-prolyl cis-trans isomerase [Gallaecimonas kandeliae]
MADYQTTEQKASYGVGRQMGDQLAQQAFDGLDIPAVQQGLADALRGEEFAVSPDDINAAFDVIRSRLEEEDKARKAAFTQANDVFLAENAKKDGVVVTDSGLQYEVLAEGEGATPSAADKVKVHYHGTLIDGTVFDSSVARGEPISFPVTGVIKGWVEALQLMKVGSKWRLTIPHDLAYGEQGAGRAIPPFAVLVFEVELLGIE